MEKKRLNPILFLKLFGKNEMWLVFEYDDPVKLSKLEDETFYRYTSLLGTFSFNKEVVKKIIDRKDQVLYLLFRSKPVEINKIEKNIKSIGGLPFLIGKISHPLGYTHAVFFGTKKKKLSDVDNDIFLLMRTLGINEYECLLGSRHDWVRTKAKTADYIQKVSYGLYQAADWKGDY